MAIKKLTLTEDHLKLISVIKFDEFNFGEKYNTNFIDDVIDEIGNSDTKLNTSSIMEGLGQIKRKIEEISSERTRFGWGVDQWNLFGGTYVLEDVAIILGKYDQMIPGTKEDPDGAKFPPELSDYMYGLYEDIYTNLTYIISLVLQFSTQGGLTPGTYKCKNYEKYWEKIENLSE